MRVSVHLDGRGQGATNDDCVRVRFFDAPVADFEQLGIGFGIGRRLSPLRVDVRFVPDLVVLDVVLVAVGEGVDKIAVVFQIIRRGKRPTLVPCRSGPGRRVAETGDNIQVVFVRQLNDVVVLLPGRPVRFVAAVLKIALAVYFYVFPGEFLANPPEPGVTDHPADALSFRRLYLLLHERVHAKRVLPRVRYGDVGPGLRHGPELPGDEIPQRDGLRGRSLLSRPGKQILGYNRAPDEKNQPQQDCQDRGNDYASTYPRDLQTSQQTAPSSFESITQGLYRRSVAGQNANTNK